MEYVWYVLASIGAGVGTGLAGLSAATVMVPILIVLCPSFAGETGVYQATAIALASDILGSAVTTITYIRHKNIDLKRSLIMVVCVLSMCAVGSYVAFLAGNIVLGGFTLFLTFCIGIRFLVKPDVSRKKPAARGEKLSGWGVAFSLFWGISIGFGTGFVGTGGGMMMLIVFTVFLGMELKTAVGTSTFIMTFTALISSVSHILIHPAILLEKWHVLLICIAVTTAASLISARFANRVGNRTVGLVTGGVLTALGGAMILLNYWESIRLWPHWLPALKCFGWYVLYLTLYVGGLVGIYFTHLIPRNIFRKLLHLMACFSYVFLLRFSESWQAAVVASLLCIALIYPLLTLAERWNRYQDMMVEKSPGEVKRSMLQMFLPQAAILALSWGALGKPYIAIASAVTWGLGDTAAAWVGRRFGRHAVRLKWADGKKTWEGTLANAVVSLIACAAVLLLRSPLPWRLCLPAALGTAVLSAFVELFSRRGIDTVTLPVTVCLFLCLW